MVKEQQEKRFEVERVTLMKNYDNDLSSMIDSQKKQVDKCEQQQHEELKVSSKRIRNEQEKELKGFRESLKQEVCHRLSFTNKNDVCSTLAGEAIKVRGGTVAERPQEGVAQDEEGSARLMRGTLCEDFKAAGAQQLLFAVSRRFHSRRK